MKARLFILLSLIVVVALLVPGVAVPTAAQSQPELPTVPIMANPPTTATPPTDAVNGLPNRLNGRVPAFNLFNPFPKSVDSTTGTTTRVSVASDGRYVAFGSWASNLVSGDTNNAFDVFLSDTIPIRYVAITGTDSGDCSTPGSACRTVQYAVDQAGEGDEIRVAAGTYTDVNNYGGLAQVVYISKTVTVRGGYTTTNWITPHPITQPTTLDAGGQGRVLYITGDPSAGSGQAISPTIEGLRITDGNAAGLSGTPYDEDAGGGVYVLTATATIRDNQISNNTAYHGGGLYLHSSTSTLSGNIVSSNIADSGGGLCLLWSDAMLSGNTVTNNSANWGGGGVYLMGSDATLSGNTVSFNTGSGLQLSGSDATLSGNTVSSNTGSGLGLAGSDATLSGNIVSSNAGGGLQLYRSDATLTNNVIADNQANNTGSGLHIVASSPRMLHTTIARNGGGDGSGIYVADWSGTYSTVALTNTILVSHTVGITVTAGNTATLEATLWGDGAWANGIDWCGDGTIITGTLVYNYWDDPAFLNPYYGDYHIGSDSAAVDAGVDTGVSVDIDGEPRPAGGSYDIGADEFQYTVTPPTLASLPDQVFDHTTSPTSTIDLWAYAWDAETPVSGLTYTIEGTPPAGAGVTLDGNRYVYVNPSTSWCGRTDVTIRVTDPGGLWDSDTFRVAVTWSCQG